MNSTRLLRFLFCLALGFFSSAVFAQTNFGKTASGEYRGSTIFEILTQLENTYGVSVCTDPNKLPWYKVDCSFRQSTLHEVLKNLLPQYGLAYVPFGDTAVAVCRLTDRNAAYLLGLRERCRSGQIVLPDFLRPLQLEKTLGQAPATAKDVLVTGFLLDADSKEGIAGAVILVDGKPGGASTNALGRFALRVPAGRSNWVVNYLGYRETQLQLEAWADGEIELPLQSSPLGLHEVQIEGGAANKTANVQTAVEALPIATIKELPTFLGEADVVKGLFTLAGVSSAGEGSTGFNVRGGNVDQNLTLQDDAPLFNTAHVLGFFSVYNPDLVRSVTLYKGHVPARFGGRLSSVLDVQLRDGDFSKVHGNVGVGIAAGKLMLEGPIVPKKLSILAGVRRSWSDWMLRWAPLPQALSSSIWFFDGLAKVSGRFGEKVNFSVSGYQTRDFLRIGKQYGYEWSNRLLDMSLRHPIGNNIVSVWQGNIGRYRANYFIPEGLDNSDLENGLNYRNLSWRMIWVPLDGHEVSAGVQWNRVSAQPESRRPRNDQSTVTPKEARKDQGEELAIFLDDDIHLSERWHFSLGARAVAYRHFGPKTVYRYADGEIPSAENLLDSTVYSAGQTVKKYLGLEPRLSLSFRLHPEASIKFSYNRMRQYVHLISNLSSPTPVDVWQVSNTYIRPQTGDQLDLGFTREWRRKTWEFAGDLFFRRSQDVPVFRNLPELLLNDHLETELLEGEGLGYGAEASFRRLKGKWTGWLTYTYTRALLRVPNPPGGETVNAGAYFPSDFDQPHQVNCYLKFNLTPAVSLGANYAYRSGRPVTAPNRVYSVGGVVVPDYSERNNARIPDYRRFDLALNIDQNKSRLSGAKVSFNFSIYNVFGRKNPFSVFFEKQQGTYPKAYSLSLAGAAIPAANLFVTF
ncbi:MAG: TonB-dependent receptor [Saprospiraceae bacterium]|nr:TonB-dependent receptor [Saprospiraceae bacterium]